MRRIELVGIIFLVLAIGSILAGLLIKIIFNCSYMDAAKTSLLVFVLAGLYGIGSSLNSD